MGFCDSTVLARHRNETTIVKAESRFIVLSAKALNIEAKTQKCGMLDSEYRH